MRKLIVVLIGLSTAPAYGALLFSLNSNTGSGTPAAVNPDSNFCVPVNCVLFTGTLLDTDTDDSLAVVSDIMVAFTSMPMDGALTLDNTFFNLVPGVLSGDPNYATDNLGNPSNVYSGPLFGIDIAPGTSFGIYTAGIAIYASGGTADPNFSGFTLTQQITVNVVAPEPSAGGLVLVGFAAMGTWFGARRKWSAC